jgi:hypothetical protein
VNDLGVDDLLELELLCELEESPDEDEGRLELLLLDERLLEGELRLLENELRLLLLELCEEDE